MHSPQKPIDDSMDVPPVPSDGYMEHHSDEEKCGDLGSVKRTRGSPSNIAPKPQSNRHSSPNTMPPKSNQSIPYIEDEPKSSKISINSNPSKDLKYRLSYLLYLEHPHPINLNDLHHKYWDLFREPLEIKGHRLDELIDSTQGIVKLDNPYAQIYDINDQNWDQQAMILQLKNVHAFIKDFDVSSKNGHHRKYDLIRDKVNKHMNQFHPEGLRQSEMDKMFRYWIGPLFTDLDGRLQQTIKQQMFDKYNDDKHDCYIIMKGVRPPQMPLSEPHRAYSLSCKFMLLCVLAERDVWTKSEFEMKFKQTFGINLDFSSNLFQKELNRLIDVEYFKKEQSFALTNDARDV